MRILVLLLTGIGVLASLSGCTGQQVLNDLTTSRGYTLTSDVPYDAANRLTLDVYMPDNAQNAPVVVFFYGKRWRAGDKSEYKFVGQALASRGFVTVIPNVRLYPRVRFPDFVNDAAKAVKWAHVNAAHYGGKSDKLFVMGHNSGAHIAAMLVLNEEYLKGVGGSRSWLRGMIGLAGLYNFMPITAPDLRDLFGPVDRFPYTQPIFFVDGSNPPLFLVHGEDDAIVAVSNTRTLAESVTKAGGPVETLIYPKMSHDLIISSFASMLRGRADVLDQVEDFIRRRSSGQPTPRASAINATRLAPEAPRDDGTVFTDSIESAPPVPVQ
ncbi:alpha/beta hydrolase [Solimonas soli]|uniref:alpha/beta hydrolase n=1 Tax=Solimonas soli TaxID=413479 RepID=UPI0004AE97D5|nr:alpha/beta hydrolase [Solimonas soli]